MQEEKLIKAATAAWHLCQSLLACREGATDELIREVSEALREAITPPQAAKTTKRGTDGFGSSGR
jgi:hypothetical protein